MIMHPTLNTLQKCQFLCIVWKQILWSYSYLVVINVCRNTIYSNKYVLVKILDFCLFWALASCKHLEALCAWIPTKCNPIEKKYLTSTSYGDWWLWILNWAPRLSPRLLHTPFERLFWSQPFPQLLKVCNLK